MRNTPGNTLPLLPPAAPTRSRRPPRPCATLDAGHEAAGDELEAAPPEMTGYAFYHEQSTERAAGGSGATAHPARPPVCPCLPAQAPTPLPHPPLFVAACGKLFVSFAARRDDPPNKDVAVGRAVVDCLLWAGLRVTWNGDHRVCVCTHVPDDELFFLWGMIHRDEDEE